MELFGDYHTHTVYSHGKGSIEDSVLRAAKLGLREIAITDHGFNHITYGVRRREIPNMRRQITELKVKYPSVKVYLGVEANIISRKGKIDVKPSDKPNLDIIVCGYHKLIWSGIGAAFNYFLPNNLGMHGKATRAANTDAYIAALANNDIDILSHPGNFCACDIKEVARACKQYKTYFELNGKRIYLTDRELEIAASEDCEFIIDSDAHKPKSVGDIESTLNRIKRIGIPLERIANYGRTPEFKRVVR